MGRSQESFGLGVQEPVAVTRVISLGGGVQSTVLTLLADEGAFGPLPDCAIFADTGWEPSAVYDNIEWLKGRTSIPIHVVSNGRNLRDDMWEGLSSQGRPWVTLPVYTLSARGKQGMAKRQCTANYKIDPPPAIGSCPTVMPTFVNAAIRSDMRMGRLCGREANG